MEGLKGLLDSEKRRLSLIEKEVEGRLKDIPEGRLRVTSSNKSVQYMHCTNESARSRSQGAYIKKKDRDLALALAQKEYDAKIYRLVEKRIKQIERIDRDYEDDEIEAVFTRLHPARQRLITPVEQTWNQVFEEWKNKEYVGKGFAPDAPQIYSRRGERVRSKSEKILADLFYDLGIYYKYEAPLDLGSMVVYPDFTFLSRKYRREIYWEHDGRMDDPEYAENAVRKIDTYVRNGIYPGEQLILTYETSRYPLNDKVAENLIRKYLL